MKCESCKYLKFHPAGSWYAVAEGGDDPYNYEYCAKGHWAGECNKPQDESRVGISDLWIDCKDFDINTK